MQRINKWIEALAGHNLRLQAGDMSTIVTMLGLCRCIEAALTGMLIQHKFWRGQNERSNPET